MRVAALLLLLAVPDGPVTDLARQLEEQRAEALAADVICGETGLQDEYLANMVAAVVSNRMQDLPGRRAEKVLKVLGKKHQFNGSCARKGETPSKWHQQLAKILVRDTHSRIPRPVWLTDDVKYFSEAKTARRWLRRMVLVGKRGRMWFFKDRKRS